MYAHLYIPNDLPQLPHAFNYQVALVVGNWAMILSLLGVALSMIVTYTHPEYFSIPVQVSGHIAMILFFTVIKIGYILRCIGLHGLGETQL